MGLRATFLLFVAALIVSSAWAQGDAAFEARLQALEKELRCLVCQNQTLADSGAGLAEDLRREVRTLARSGKTDAEIKEFLVARYGDFVLYRPPVKATTWALWFGPFALLAAGAAIWWITLRRRRTAGGGAAAAAEAPPRADALARARALLDDTRLRENE